MKPTSISMDQVIQKRKDMGLKLKELREARGLTMDELGDKLGIGKATVSKIEAGKWNFGFDTLTMFCVELGVNIDLK